MLLVWALPVGVVAGYLGGGRLHRLGLMSLRWGGLLWGALLIQVLVFPFGSRPPLLPVATEALHLFSYALLLAFVLGNIRYSPLGLVAVGLGANLLVIALNGGRMPACPEALRRAGLDEVASALVSQGQAGNLVLLTQQTRLGFLGDILALPAWFPLAAAFSVGDVMLGLGVAVAIAVGMRGPRPRRT